MAINYVAPSPPPQVFQHAYAGGGGGGAISPQMYAAQQGNEMDYLRLIQQKAAMGGPTGRDLFHADVQMAGIQQHAEAAAWLSQQEMTQRDVMDLKNKQNLVSMISNDQSLTAQEKSDSIMQIRTGIDIAKKRLNDEQIKAQAENRRAMAEDHQARVRMRDNAIEFQKAELSGKIDYHILPEHEIELSQIMKDAHPDTPQGSPEYDGMRLMEARQNGWAIRALKKADGTVILDPKSVAEDQMGVVGAHEKSGTAKSQAQQGEPRVQDAYHSVDKATAATQSWAKAQETPPSPDQEEAYYQKVLKRYKAESDTLHANTPEGQKKAAGEQHQAAMTGIGEQISQLKDMPGISPAERTNVGRLLNEVQRLMKEYPLGGSKPRPASIQQRIDRLTDQYKQFEGVVTGRQTKAAQVVNAAAPTQAAQSPPARSSEEQMLRNMGSGVLEAAGQGIRSFAGWANIPSGQ